MATRYREILRLHAQGLSSRDIAPSASCSGTTVRRVIKRAKEMGLEWPLPEEMGDAQLQEILYPNRRQKRGGWAEPDYEWVHKELARKGVTRSLLYEEYCDACRAANKSSCSQSTFNNGYVDWAKNHNVTMHIEHKPGVKLEVDWAGAKMALCCRDTGEIIDVHVFVGCLPFSGKLYAEGFLSMDSEAWLTAHVRMLDFYGGVPEELVPDNCRTAVTSHKRGEDAVINKSYADLARHYGCIVSPARTYRPKDKANVEAGVGIITRRAIAPLRNRTFFTLGELNAALLEKVIEINASAFAKKPGSRASIFDSQEKDLLAPLPRQPFPVCSWERMTVRSDYHISVRGCFYSVPFEYIGKVVDVRITQPSIEIFFQDIRIASHVRSFEEHAWITSKTHMPENHISYVEWNIEGLAKQAQDVGPACERAMALVIDSQETKQKSLGQGKSLLALARRYGTPILEEACEKALSAGKDMVCSVEAIQCICQASYKIKGNVEDSGKHAILRGADYYRKGCE